MAADQDRVLDFQDLTADQRAVAWAVVRSITTALWVAVFATFVALVVVVGKQGGVPLLVLVPTAGLLALAGVMEVKSRDLETPAGPRPRP